MHASPATTAAPTAGGTVEDGLEAVLALVQRHLAVFPLPKGGRKPHLKDWPNRATADLETIRRHWPPGANIGVPCKPNNLLGVDLDRHDPAKDGVEAFTALCEQHGQPWPYTFTVRTPRQGLHLYYWSPAGRRFGNSSSRIGPGIDTRGPGAGSNGGYLIGPGSVVNGKAYEVVRDAPIIELPSWIADLLNPPRPPVKWTGPLPKLDDRYVAAALKGEVQRILDAPVGSRNDQLNRSAYALGRLVGAGLLDVVTAEVALRRSAEAVGLVAEDGQRQTDATITSGLTAGTRNPRHLLGVR